MKVLALLFCTVASAALSRIWTSVPQIVVVVMRRRAPFGPTSGMGLSARMIRPGSTKIAARILAIMLPISEKASRGAA